MRENEETEGSAKRWNWQVFWGGLRNRCRKAMSLRMAQRKRDLALEERLALGDKYFLAIVRCGAERFLIAGAPASVALLANLRDSSAFAEQLAQARGVAQ